MLRFFAAAAASVTLAAVVLLCMLHADTWVVSDANVSSAHRFFGYPLLFGALGTAFVAACIIALAAAVSSNGYPWTFWCSLLAIPLCIGAGFAFYDRYSPPGFVESKAELDSFAQHVVEEAQAADGVYDERFDPELRLGSVEVERVVYSQDWDDVEVLFFDTDCFIGPCGWVYRPVGEPTAVHDTSPLDAGWFDFGR